MERTSIKKAHMGSSAVFPGPDGLSGTIEAVHPLICHASKIRFE